jgi:hypothetical protein
VLDRPECISFAVFSLADGGRLLEVIVFPFFCFFLRIQVDDDLEVFILDGLDCRGEGEVVRRYVHNLLLMASHFPRVQSSLSKFEDLTNGI